MRTLLLILNALYVIKIHANQYHTARLWNPLTWVLLILVALWNGLNAMLLTIQKVVKESLEATFEEQNGKKVERNVNANGVNHTV